MAKARQGKQKMEELKPQDLAIWRVEKGDFPQSQNKNPRSWWCSPCPYKFNEPKSTEIGVCMRK
jgi:hypothetical protein